MMWKQVILSCALLTIILLSEKSTVADDQGEPKWFPDLSCHPGAKAKNIDRLRDEAKKCNHLEKTDPCLIHCVLNHWSLYVDQESFEFCPHRTQRFFIEVRDDDDDYSLEKGRALEQCKKDLLRDVTFKGEKIPFSKLCQQPVFECMEAVMNCSKDTTPVSGPPKKAYKLFDLSCHPESKINYPLLSSDLLQAEDYCLTLFKTNRICTMVCATHGYPSNYRNTGENDFFVTMNRYADAVKRNDNRSVYMERVHLQQTVVGIDQERFYAGWGGGYGPEQAYATVSTETATKIISNCLDLWMSTSSLNWENCEEDQAKWEPLIECLDNVFRLNRHNYGMKDPFLSLQLLSSVRNTAGSWSYINFQLLSIPRSYITLPKNLTASCMQVPQEISEFLHGRSVKVQISAVAHALETEMQDLIMDRCLETKTLTVLIVCKAVKFSKLKLKVYKTQKKLNDLIPWIFRHSIHFTYYIDLFMFMFEVNAFKKI